MKILLDHNVPKRFGQSIAGHEVRRASEMDWAELSNGRLLDAAEAAGFEVLLTCDKSLTHQQNLAGRTLAIVVLDSLSNRYERLLPFVEPLLRELPAAVAGTVMLVRAASPEE